MSLDLIHSCIHPLSLPTQLYVLYFHIKPNLWYLNNLGHMVIYWILVDLSEATVLENSDPSFPATKLIISPQLGVDILSQLLSPYLDWVQHNFKKFCKCCHNCCGILCAGTLQCPRESFLVVISLFCLLPSLTLLFHNNSWTFRWGHVADKFHLVMGIL